MKSQTKILYVAAALAFAGQVSAATDWTLTNTPTAGVSAINAYANTGGSDTSASAANNGATQTIQAATWVSSYGGITNADACTSGSYCDVNEGVSPEHAIDNNQRYDMALISFTQSVKLTNLSLGYISGDSDLTVLAYTGAGNPNTSIAGKTYSQLAGLGWLLIGNYAGDATTYNRTINTSGVYSSYWLIGAYNPLAGGATSGLNVGDDNIKLASVSGCVSGGCPVTTPQGQVPEPGSLALFGIAILGIIRLRKARHC